MVESLERLDEDSLRDLSRQTDELGVLSVYLDTDARDDPNLRGTAIDLKNRYRELQRRLGESESDHSGAVVAALERLWPHMEHLTAPFGSGRSRMAFVALDSDWTLQLHSAMPVSNRLVLGDGPFLHPLLEMLDEGRPAGVVVVGADQARISEWRLGSLHSLSTLEQDYVQAPHERAGHLGGGPAGQFNSPKREQRQSRERVQTERFVDEVIEAAAKLADERRWERILVSGGDRLTESATSKFPQPLRDKVFADSRVLSGLDDAALATTVTKWAHDQHAERERGLLSRVRDAAGTGAAAVGLSEVAAALNAGRVAHLVYDPEVRYAGTVGGDGALYGGEEVGPEDGTADPRFTERLIERALETRARISPVEGAATGILGDASGVAALLRW
ncbi:MSMEG_1130 family ribosome hibernation factor [Mycolicibacterium sp. XJ1819]